MTRIVSADAAVSTRWLRGSLTQQLLRGIYDRGGDPVFRRLGDAPLACRRHEDDLVLLGVEADVVAGHVVVDDEIDTLPVQFLARARETLLPLVGGKPHQHLTVRAPLRERAQDVRRRLEAHLPRALVLR